MVVVMECFGKIGMLVYIMFMWRVLWLLRKF